MASTTELDAFLSSSDSLSQIKSFSSNQALSASLLETISLASAQAISSHHKFTIALSGGSLPSILSLALNTLPQNSIDFSHWQVFFADERFVPLTDPESNFKLCSDHFFSKVPIPSDNIHPISIPSTNCVDDCAKSYQSLLEKQFGYDSTSQAHPIFDMILLGMGPDGHTASLFPHSPVLNEVHRWVASIKDSPKPPRERITLTLPILNRANRIIFVVTGEAKAEVLRRVLEEQDELIPKGELPSRMVNPGTGKIWWFVDEAAAKSLTKKTSHNIADIVREEKISDNTDNATRSHNIV